MTLKVFLRRKGRTHGQLSVSGSPRVTRLADVVEAYIDEAIAVEEAGLKVGPAPEPVLVGELKCRLDRDPALKAAFEALTRGRQREYNLYFSCAKQAKTRAARVDRYAPKISEGKGFRYR